jgi:hypothetical protein
MGHAVPEILNLQARYQVITLLLKNEVTTVIF